MGKVPPGHSEEGVLATNRALVQFVNANDIELGKERTRALKLPTAGSCGWN
jgi:hypothetical protein